MFIRGFTHAKRITERGRLRLKVFSESGALKNPMSKIDDDRIYLDTLSKAVENACGNILDRKRHVLAVGASKLEALSPLSALERGFSLTKDKSGNILKSVKGLNAGDEIGVTLSDGSVSAVVSGVERR